MTPETALELTSFFWPTLLTCFLAWFLAGEALAIYDLASDTLLLAFCVDAKLAKARKNKNLKASASYKQFIATNSAKDVFDDEGGGDDDAGRARRASVASAIDHAVGHASVGHAPS